MKAEPIPSISEMARVALCSRGTIRNLLAAGKIKQTLSAAYGLRRDFLCEVASKLNRSLSWQQRESALQLAVSKKLVELARERE